MKDVNWWLMTLAFLLGLLLTFGMMVRRVTREVPVTATVSAIVAAGGAAGTLESVLEKEPYGVGSIRLVAAATEPGFTIKGNEDSMLYHTTDSPWYKKTVAEVWFADEESATRAGFTRWDAGQAGGTGVAAPVASIEEVPAGPYGRGSALPGADGGGPAGWPIKGNVDSMLYHPPDSPAYTETIAEVWFFDEETAKAAGFDKWDKNFR